MESCYQDMASSAAGADSYLKSPKPINTILTPTSNNTSVNEQNKQKEQQDSETVSLYKDKEFFKSAAIHNIKEVEGREKSLIALRGTYKNIDKADNVSNIMRGLDTQNWLLSRHKGTTKEFYVKTKNQLQAQYDVENVFFKFDDDCSGTLDAQELQQMFEQHGIQINLQDVKKLFDTIDENKRGLLNLDQFKLFSQSKDAQDFFKEKIKEIRNSRLTHDGKYYCTQQLPFNFNIMLEYLSSMTKRQEKLNEIDKIGVSRRKADQIMGMFEDLFDLRETGLKRDLVGMEEVKTRLKRKGEELDELKKIAEEKRRKQLRESKQRSSSRLSTVSPNMISRRVTMRSQNRGLMKGVTYNAGHLKMQKASTTKPKLFKRQQTEHQGGIQAFKFGKQTANSSHDDQNMITNLQIANNILNTSQDPVASENENEIRSQQQSPDHINPLVSALILQQNNGQSINELDSKVKRHTAKLIKTSHMNQRGKQNAMLDYRQKSKDMAHEMQLEQSDLVNRSSLTQSQDDSVVAPPPDIAAKLSAMKFSGGNTSSHVGAVTSTPSPALNIPSTTTTKINQIKVNQIKEAETPADDEIDQIPTNLNFEHQHKILKQQVAQLINKAKIQGRQKGQEIGREFARQFSLRNCGTSNESSQESLGREGQFSSPQLSQNYLREPPFNIQEADEPGSEATNSMFATVNRIEKEVEQNIRNSQEKIIGPFPSVPLNSDPQTRRNISKNFYYHMPRSSMNFTNKKQRMIKQYQPPKYKNKLRLSQDPAKAEAILMQGSGQKAPAGAKTNQLSQEQLFEQHKSTSARNLFDQINAVRQSSGGEITEATSVHIVGGGNQRAIEGAESDLKRYTKMSQHKFEPVILRSEQQIRAHHKKHNENKDIGNSCSQHNGGRKDTPQSTAFESNRLSKEYTMGTQNGSQLMKTLGVAQMQAGVTNNNILHSASTVSEKGGINPYISSERLQREHPLKFGLKRKSYNTHLSTQMEPKSPQFDNIIAASANDDSGPSNIIISEAADENHAVQQVEFRPNKRGTFFGSSKSLRKSQGLTEARMDFSMHTNAQTASGVMPHQISYYQNITKQLSNRPLASYQQRQGKILPQHPQMMQPQSCKEADTRNHQNSIGALGSGRTQQSKLGDKHINTEVVHKRKNFIAQQSLAKRRGISHFNHHPVNAALISSAGATGTGKNSSSGLNKLQSNQNYSNRIIQQQQKKFMEQGRQQFSSKGLTVQLKLQEQQNQQNQHDNTQKILPSSLHGNSSQKSDLLKSHSNYRSSARQLRVSNPAPSDFLARRTNLQGAGQNQRPRQQQQQHPPVNQSSKFLELAKKSERLTTDDDIKILNSFMSSTQDMINPLDESSKMHIEMEQFGELSQTDNLQNLRQSIMHHKNHPSISGGQRRSSQDNNDNDNNDYKNSQTATKKQKQSINQFQQSLSSEKRRSKNEGFKSSQKQTQIVGQYLAPTELQFVDPPYQDGPVVLSSSIQTQRNDLSSTTSQQQTAFIKSGSNWNNSVKGAKIPKLAGRTMMPQRVQYMKHQQQQKIQQQQQQQQSMMNNRTPGGADNTTTRITSGALGGAGTTSHLTNSIKKAMPLLSSGGIPGTKQNNFPVSLQIDNTQTMGETTGAQLNAVGTALQQHNRAGSQQSQNNNHNMNNDMSSSILNSATTTGNQLLDFHYSKEEQRGTSGGCDKSNTSVEIVKFQLKQQNQHSSTNQNKVALTSSDDYSDAVQAIRDVNGLVARLSKNSSENMAQQDGATYTQPETAYQSKNLPPTTADAAMILRSSHQQHHPMVLLNSDHKSRSQSEENEHTLTIAAVDHQHGVGAATAMNFAARGSDGAAEGSQ